MKSVNNHVRSASQQVKDVHRALMGFIYSIMSVIANVRLGISLIEIRPVLFLLVFAALNNVSNVKTLPQLASHVIKIN